MHKILETHTNVYIYIYMYLMIIFIHEFINSNKYKFIEARAFQSSDIVDTLSKNIF